MKTVTLQFEFLELNGKPMFNRETYDKPGQYVVTDGIAYYIVSVPEEAGMGIGTCVIPKEVFEKKIAEEAKFSAERDFTEQMKGKFDKIISSLISLKDTPKQAQTNGISESGLIKIIEMLTKYK